MKARDKLRNIIMLVLSISVFAHFALAMNNNTVNIWFFYSNYCPHCHKVLSSGVLDSIDANVTMLSLDNSEENRKLFKQIAQNYKIIAGVPTVVIFTDDPMKGKVLQGDDPIIQNLASYVKSYNITLENVSNKTKPTKSGITLVSRNILSDLAFILGVAAADSINPCIMAVMLIMLATLATMDEYKKMKGFGILYILTVYFSYLAIGVILMLGALWLINQLTIFATEFALATKIVVAAILVIAGIINIKDFFFWGKGISFNITEEHKKKVIEMAKKASVLAVLSIAIFVTIVEFPCSGIMYLGAIFYFVSTGINPALLFGYLLIYNIIFVLPLVVMLAIALSSKRAAESGVGKATNILMRNKERFRLLLGIGLLVLAYIVLVT